MRGRLRSSLQRIPDHFRHVLSQVLDGCDAFQRGACVGLPCGIKLPPAVEAAGNTRGHLRVHRLQYANDVGYEGVAAAVGDVKSGLGGGVRG